MSVSLGELAVRFGCELRGDPDTRVERVATLAGARGRRAHLSRQPALPRASSSAHAPRPWCSRRGGGRVPDGDAGVREPVRDVRAHRGAAASAARRSPRACIPSALVAASARIDPSASVGRVRGHRRGRGHRARALRRSAQRARAGVHARRGRAARGARDLGGGVQSARARCCSPGAVIGADGFGFAPERGGWVKVPQLGAVRVGRGRGDRRQHHHRSRCHRGHGDRGGREARQPRS